MARKKDTLELLVEKGLITKEQIDKANSEARRTGLSVEEALARLGFISEVDIAKISLGLKAEIKLDAFSDTVYHGEVISIANLAQFKETDSKIKIFPVEVLIDDKSIVFLPGMTVSCRIIIDMIDDVLFIPLETLFTEENKQYVYVLSGNSYDKRIIETKQKNNDYIIVQKGLEKDELIAMSDPFPEDDQKQQIK